MAGTGSSTRSTREVVNLHTDIFDFLCTFHRVKRLPPKDTNPGAITSDEKISDEQRGELLNRYLYKILNEIELRISALEGMSESVTSDFYDEWAFLTWTLFSILNRLQSESIESKSFLDYRGKHFGEKINSALVELVNKAQRIQPPKGVSQNEPTFEQFYQAYVSTLISLHHLMNRQPSNVTSQHNNQFYSQTGKWLSYSEFEARVAQLKEEMYTCFRFQRDFCNNHSFLLWQKMRNSQVYKMTQFEYENKEFMVDTMSFYSNILYNLGVLAARLQSFHHELRSNNLFVTEVDVIEPLLRMVEAMVDSLLCDALICMEPNQSAILVTNNLFPMKIVSLCRSVFFKEFSLQIVSEEIAQQIQQEMRHRKAIEPSLTSLPLLSWPSVSAALLAMKPSSGVKRNNATASAEGGNTAHKKSDVNSKEWISIPPYFDSEHQCWIATYPHLLCTTRQKDSFLDTRSAAQIGKRPLFYFHVKAEIFGFFGRFTDAHTLSLPFTIATRRNQDCQVQRMMSSYTATCFWLYGTKIIDGLLIQWYDNEIEWKNFKTLFAQHFSSNAEVRRTLVDVDFNVLQDKMHCNDCTDRLGFRNKQGFDPTTTVSFKNVLCPHLHYTAGNIDLRFSIWRGMLELQHLFSDQRTDVKILWENGLLQGFMDPDEVQNNLQAVDSGLIMRLSFVMGCCVCFSVKSSNKILNLEPLDIRRLQSKSLYEYLRDIITAEEIRYVLNMNKEWLHVNDVIKMCQRVGALDSYNLTMKEIKSNAMRTGGVEVEETFCFTPMRIAVVTCKQPNVDDGKLDVSSTTFNNSVHGDMSNQQLHLQSTIIGGKSIHPEDFFERLDSLLLAYNKTKNDLIDYAYANQPRTVPINADIKKRKMSENSSPSNLSKAANLSFSIAPYERHMPNSYCLSSSSTSTMQHQEQQPQTVCYSHPSTSQQITNHQQLTMSSGISNNSIMESHNNQIIQHQSEAPSMHHYSTIYSHHLPPNDSPTVDTSIQDFDFKKQNINHYIQEPSSYHRYDKQLEMPQIHHSWPIDQQHIASFSPHQQQHHHHQPIPQSQQLNQYDKTELSVKSIHMPTIIHLPQHQQYLNSQSHQNPLNF